MTEEYLQYKSSSPDVGVYDADDGKWIIGDLDKDAEVQIIITATTLQEGFAFNRAVVSSNERDISPSSNAAIVSINILKEEEDG